MHHNNAALCLLYDLHEARNTPRFHKERLIAKVGSPSYFIFASFPEWVGGFRRASSDAELACSMERGSLATLVSHLPDNLYPGNSVSISTTFL